MNKGKQERERGGGRYSTKSGLDGNSIVFEHEGRLEGDTARGTRAWGGAAPFATARALPLAPSGTPFTSPAAPGRAPRGVWWSPRPRALPVVWGAPSTRHGTPAMGPPRRPHTE